MLRHRGHNVNWIESKSGATAAFAAAQEGQHKCLSLLIEHGGADMSKAATGGWGPIHIACQSGTDLCVALLLDSGGVGVNVRTGNEDDFTPLIICCVNDHVKCLKVVIDRGADLNLSDNIGQTAVHWACKEGHIESLKLLLKRGANISQKNFDGETPMDYAREQGFSECEDLLLWHGAKGTLTKVRITVFCCAHLCSFFRVLLPLLRFNFYSVI
jgi:ankyrin repeat protein